MLRDQRTRVRQAEDEIYGGRVAEWREWYEQYQAEDFLRQVMSSEWFGKRFGSVAIPTIQLHRGYKHSYKDGTIRLGQCSLNRWRLLSCLALYLAGTSNHGRAYVGTYLALVKRWIGREHWKELRAMYQLKGVPYRTPDR